jgi:hypothetical protein
MGNVEGKRNPVVFAGEARLECAFNIVVVVVVVSSKLEPTDSGSPRRPFGTEGA